MSVMHMDFANSIVICASILVTSVCGYKLLFLVSASFCVYKPLCLQAVFLGINSPFLSWSRFSDKILQLLGACTGTGVGGVGGHAHDKHHPGTGGGSGFGSDQGYGTGNNGTGNNVKSHVPGTQEHR